LDKDKKEPKLKNMVEKEKIQSYSREFINPFIGFGFYKILKV